jgi:hypothetical protein
MSTILSTIAQKTKAHHVSVNAAYSTYYPSPSTSPAASTATSPRQSMDSTTSNNTTSSKKSNSTWYSIKKAAHEHHESLNSAYAVYYGAGAASRGSSATSSAVQSPRGSLEEAEQAMISGKPGQENQKKERGVSKAWEKVKKAAKEHHESVNAAHRAYYGAGVSRP